MAISKFLIGSAIAAVTAAMPMITRESSSLRLNPAVHPDVDVADVSNLKATTGMTLHYDSDANPSADSVTATVSAPSSSYPIVQVDNTKYIKSVTCTSNTAAIAFSDANAFNTAAQDWASQGQFVVVSNDPKCGSVDGKRAYALVNDMSTDKSSMTVNAHISMVDFEQAVGGDTKIRTSLGKYTANQAVGKRTSKSETVTWNEYPTNTLSDTQWGPGFQLYSGSEFDLVCVNCGTQGSLTITGNVDWSITSGIDSADVSVAGNMAMTLEVGVNAKSVSQTIPIASMQLAQIPLAAIEVPEIMTIGPQIDISASASVTIAATGSLLLGATLNWPSVSADLVLDGDGTTGGSGWSPSFNPVSQIQGSVSATLNLDLPVELGIGVNLLDGKFDKKIGVIDTPGLRLTGGVSTSGTCSGVDVEAGVVNNVVADLAVTQIPIASFSTALYSTCIGGGSPTPAARAVYEKVVNGRRYRKVA